jgi:hypothetical protein
MIVTDLAELTTRALGSKSSVSGGDPPTPLVSLRSGLRMSRMLRIPPYDSNRPGRAHEASFGEQIELPGGDPQNPLVSLHSGLCMSRMLRIHSYDSNRPGRARVSLGVHPFTATQRYRRKERRRTTKKTHEFILFRTLDDHEIARQPVIAYDQSIKFI